MKKPLCLIPISKKKVSVLKAAYSPKRHFENILSSLTGSLPNLNTYPTEIDTRLSVGMPYPRRTPIGYHSGMLFTRLTYNF